MLSLYNQPFRNFSFFLRFTCTFSDCLSFSRFQRWDCLKLAASSDLPQRLGWVAPDINLNVVYTSYTLTTWSEIFRQVLSAMLKCFPKGVDEYVAMLLNVCIQLSSIASNPTSLQLWLLWVAMIMTSTYRNCSWVFFEKTSGGKLCIWLSDKLLIRKTSK